jgi:hypothetical protein
LTVVNSIDGAGFFHRGIFPTIVEIWTWLSLPKNEDIFSRAGDRTLKQKVKNEIWGFFVAAAWRGSGG